MFKNRAVQVSVVKKNDQTGEVAVEKPFMTPEEAHSLTRAMIKDFAIATVAVLAASTILHTAGELVIRALETNIKE